MPEKTNFQSSKEDQVQHIFNTIAAKYDYLNPIMSFGIHHYWQRKFLQLAGPLRGKTALDLCCGTGNVTMDLARLTGSEGKVVGVDFSEAMLQIAEQRLKKSTFRKQLQFIKANARKLPFPNNTFDCITIAYGLRNVADPAGVLREMKRVVRPGGEIAILEMSKPDLPVIKHLYEIYLNHWVPYLGGLIADNRPAYQYFHDSIQTFPDPQRISGLLSDIGFELIKCHPLSLGIVTVHTGHKALS